MLLGNMGYKSKKCRCRKEENGNGTEGIFEILTYTTTVSGGGYKIILKISKD
ncbi:hypothetical protein AGMMS50268_06750 [Spirochaetia bacterium]|nr:hypothetical protein AGMMS50268_06750 [Spirochaetia bacterium]